MWMGDPDGFSRVYEFTKDVQPVTWEKQVKKVVESLERDYTANFFGGKHVSN